MTTHTDAQPAFIFDDMHTLIFSSSEWGYVRSIADFSSGKIFDEEGLATTPDGLHVLRQDIDGRILPGEPDLKFNKHTGYGHVRPPDTEGPDAGLWASWLKSRVARLDYYVSQRNGAPDPAATPLLYPERLFVTAEGDEDEPLSRTDLMRHLQAVGVPHMPFRWEPVQVYTGLRAGYPVFRQGVRSDTDFQVTWYTVSSKLNAELPTGYHWVASGGSHGTLYFDAE